MPMPTRDESRYLRRRVADLLRAGSTRKQIRSRLGVTEHFINGIAKGIGITPRRTIGRIHVAGKLKMDRSIDIRTT